MVLVLDNMETDLVLQWFNSVQDINPDYLEKKDYVLAIKIHEALKLRIPNSVKAGAGV